MKKKIALLDLGGVVFQSTGVSNKIIDWKTISKLNNIYGHDLNIGKDLFATFLNDYNTITSQNLTGTTFLTAVFDTLEINSALIDGIGEHFEIVIVSDNYKENIEYIAQRYHFEKWSTRQIYSFDYQMEKANPLFFSRLLKETGYSTDDLVFIDDSPKKLESAKKNGIKGILFSNNEQVKLDLRNANYF